VTPEEWRQVLGRLREVGSVLGISVLVVVGFVAVMDALWALGL
jgi:hypothetical protein